METPSEHPDMSAGAAEILGRAKQSTPKILTKVEEAIIPDMIKAGPEKEENVIRKFRADIEEHLYSLPASDDYRGWTIEEIEELYKVVVGNKDALGMALW